VPKPPAPAITNIPTPGWLKYASSVAVDPASGPVHDDTTAFAPNTTAELMPAPKNDVASSLLASTSSSLQFGHAADIICRSRSVCTAHPALAVGSGVTAPFWLTFLKQPLAVVHGGSPNCER
jgi:hypothetical protein